MANARPGGSPSPLRAALAAKTTLRTYFDVAIVPTEDVEAAQRAVAVARQMVAATLLHEDDTVKAKAETALTAAETNLAACFHRIWFRGLSDRDFDALVALHPPTAEQAKEKWIWNPDTFNYALLEACVVDGDLTAAEWETELDSDRWSRADKAQMFAMALAANRQTMADAIPKD